MSDIELLFWLLFAIVFLIVSLITEYKPKEEKPLQSPYKQEFFPDRRELAAHTDVTICRKCATVLELYQTYCEHCGFKHDWEEPERYSFSGKRYSFSGKSGVVSDYYWEKIKDSHPRTDVDYYEEKLRRYFEEERFWEKTRIKQGSNPSFRRYSKEDSYWEKIRMKEGSYPKYGGR